MDKSLKIMQIKSHNEYVLQDTVIKEQYRLILEFHDMDKPQVGDVLLLNENLLNPKYEWYGQPYAFEKLDNDKTDLKEIDLAGIFTKNKKYILKRVYG